MKLSKFVLEQPHKEGVLLKQLLTGAVISLSEIDYREIAAGDFSRLEPETVEGLLGCRFLVDDDENDHFRQFMSEWQGANVMALYFSPTTNCNFDCVYCYEDGIDRSLTMSELTVNKTIDWLRDYLHAHRDIEKLNLILHGGEPTMAKKAIRKFLVCAATICESLGVELSTSIVTNGALLNDAFASMLSEYNLYRVQVTVDGFKEVHDARRFFKSGKGSYDVVLANLKNLVAKGYSEKVLVRVNIDEENLTEVRSFLVFLANDPVLAGKIQVSLGVVTPTSGCNGHISAAEKYVIDSRLQTTSDADTYLGIRDVARNLGFETMDEFMVGPWCAARMPHAWLIGPLGEIYKCASDLGRPERSVGCVDGDIDATSLCNLSEGRLEGCLQSDCELVPICGGGCLFDHLSEPGSACRKDFLLAINRGLMQNQAE